MEKLIVTKDSHEIKNQSNNNKQNPQQKSNKNEIDNKIRGTKARHTSFQNSRKFRNPSEPGVDVTLMSDCCLAPPGTMGAAISVVFVH